MAEYYDSLRSSALVPGLELWPSEWNPLNRVMLTIPKDVPVLRYLRVRVLDSRHSRGLKLLHSRLFPVAYDNAFFDATCGIPPLQCTSKEKWHTKDVLGLGLFLPLEVITTYCDYGGLICCESDDSSSSKKSDVDGTTRSNETLSNQTDEDESDRSLYLDINLSPDQPSSNSPEQGLNANVNACILNDPTYDRSRNEFLVGFVTLMRNRSEDSYFVSPEDSYWLGAFFKDMIYPLFQECPDDDERINRFLNYDMMSPDFYYFLYKNLYLNDELLEGLAYFGLAGSVSVYVLSAGITMGLRSRLLGTHLILFMQCLVYLKAYNVHIFNRNMYYFPSFVHEEVMENLRSHFSSMHAEGCHKKDSVIEQELDLYRLMPENVIENYRKQADMPLTIYLHAVSYNRKACAMYRRTNFVCITRYKDYYVINNVNYPANLLAYYVFSPV